MRTTWRKRAFSLLLVIMICVGLFPTAAFAADDRAPGTYLIGTTDLREEPNSNAAVVTTVAGGTAVKVHGTQDGWTKISAGEYTGWVLSTALEKVVAAPAEEKQEEAPAAPAEEKQEETPAAPAEPESETDEPADEAETEAAEAEAVDEVEELYTVETDEEIGEETGEETSEEAEAAGEEIGEEAEAAEEETGEEAEAAGEETGEEAEAAEAEIGEETEETEAAEEEDEAEEEPEELSNEIVDTVLYANDSVYLSGKMPERGIVEAVPVSVQLPGERVLAAWQLRLRMDENDQEGSWQPEESLQLHIRSDAFTGPLAVYAMSGSTQAAAYLGSASASDGWLSFEIGSLGFYAVTAVQEKTLVATDNASYAITVRYDNRSGILPGAELHAREITGGRAYNGYVQESAEQIGADVENLDIARVFDIYLSYPGSKEHIDPSSAVQVNIQLLNQSVTPGDEVSVVHFGSETETMDSSVAGRSLQFETGSFSVYVVVKAGAPLGTTEECFAKQMSDLLNEDGSPKGFYISGQSLVASSVAHSFYYMTNQYVTGTKNGVSIQELMRTPENDISSATLFYFEPVDSTEGNTFKIYYLEGDQKNYLITSTENVKDLAFVTDSDQATVFTVNFRTDLSGVDYAVEIRGNGKWLDLQGVESGPGFQGYGELLTTDTAIRLIDADSISLEEDPYGLDGKNYAIVYDSPNGSDPYTKSMSSEAAGNTKLKGDLGEEAEREDGNLVSFTSENGEKIEWTFRYQGNGKYLLQAKNGKYLQFYGSSNASIRLVDDEAEATEIAVSPAVEGREKDGKYLFSLVVGTTKVLLNTFTTSSGNFYGTATNKSSDSEWFYLAAAPRTVSYEYNGSVPDGAGECPDESDYPVGETVTVADAPTAPAGYSFDGWSKTGSFTMPDNDVVITGSFSANTDTPYTVEHYLQNLNGGYALEETEHLTGTTGTTATAQAKTYTGFAVNETAEGTAASGAISGDGTLKLKLYYDRLSYQVSFVDEDGTTVLKEAAPYVYGTAAADIVKPADPTKTGHTFAGWTPEIAAVTGDVSYKASYTVNNYTITYMVDGAQDGSAETFAYGAAVTARKEPTKTGYTFGGWDPEVPGTMPAENLVIEGSFTANQYTVAFNANRGEGTMAAQTFTYDAAQALRSNSFTRTDYFFAGWNTMANGKGISYSDGARVRNLTAANNGTVTLYAQWAEKDDLIMTVTGYHAVYDGATHSVAANARAATGATRGTTTIEYSVNGGRTWSTYDPDNAPGITDVGTQQVRFRATNPNYKTVTANTTLQVTKRPVTVFVNNTGKVYGENDPQINVDHTGLVGNDRLDGYGAARDQGENVGNYNITLNRANERFVGRSINNYDITYRNGTFTVTPAPATVTAVNTAKEAGEEDPAFTATVTGLRRGDPATVITYTLARAEGEEAGEYAITPTGERFQGNYDVTYVPAALTITAAEVIEDPEPPMAEPTEPEVIPDDPVPQTAPPTWALLNLIFMALSGLGALGMVLSFFKKDGGAVQKSRKSKLFGLISALAAVVTFIATEDMSGMMAIADKWTALMGAYAAVTGVLAYLTRNQQPETKETGAV